jgi:diadenosine tetraphosphate (Ap4A) HIT family hydrolase
MALSPFVNETPLPLVTILGTRCGYIQLATSTYTESYHQLPVVLFEAACAWARQLEALGAKRVYWITLSEVVTHLHIHLYPRWETDTLKGMDLFQDRENPAQPVWTDETSQCLQQWARQHQVYLLNDDPLAR